MKKLIPPFFSFLVLLTILTSCEDKTQPPLDMKNIYAWCIVPFDSENRTPAQRIDMLKALGFRSYAYDWREKHLPEMKEEFALAIKNDIEIKAVWMWIDVADSVDSLSANNEKILEILEETGTKTQLWVGISEACFEKLTEDQSMSKAVDMISYLNVRAARLGCKVGLYNHGGWFGDPLNQVKLIKAMPGQKPGIIFNFHHAHEILDDYPELVDAMMPYLWAVNLNGMKEEGPKILPIGKGNLEGEMIRLLEEKGYRGPYGVLGHVEEADVKVILERNLEGLRYLQK
jgi:hypothetical protein